MIYFDNAATTGMFPECADIMKEFSVSRFYNPSALYMQSIEIMREINAARELIASHIGVDGECLFFMGSATEADNTVLYGVRKRKNSNIVISALEHSANQNYAMSLFSQGVDVRIAQVDSEGVVHSDELLSLVDSNTALVSIIHVNNETGGVNDIVSLSAAVKKKNPNVIFHSDGVQAFLKVPVKLKFSNVDLYTINAHKTCGPKGIAALYIKKGLHLNSLLKGGEQEKGLRPSTENVAAIMAWAQAVKLFPSSQEFASNCLSIKNAIIEFLINNMPEVIINSGTVATVDNVLSLAFPRIKGEILLHVLEQHGILVGIGSACSSKTKEKRVPLALGLPNDYHNGIIRLSFGVGNTVEDAYEFIKVLPECLKTIKY